MTFHYLSGMRWPNRKQLLLLQALAGNDKTFLRLWKSWKKLAGNYRDLDGGTLDLFPYLYKRLKTVCPDDSWMTVAKNSYRYHWLHNKLLVSTGSQCVSLLESCGITPLVIKGAAWIPLYYESDWGARKLEDIDIFVGHKQFLQALAILQDNGWAIASEAERTYLSPHFAHAVSLVRDNFHLDLHVYLFFSHYRGEDSTLFFPNSLQTFQIHDTSITTLSDSDQLVHACVNGIERGRVTNLRLVIDLLKILRHGNIDWDRVVTLSQIKQVGPQVYGSLKYLVKHFTIAIDPTVLAKLSRLRPSLPRRRLLKLNLSPSTPTTISTFEYYFWIYVEAIEHKWNPAEWMIKAIIYLKYRLRVSRTTGIPAALFGKFSRWLKKTWFDPTFS